MTASANKSFINLDRMRSCFLCGSKAQPSFEFPRSITLRRKWLTILQGKYKLENLREGDVICVKHFTRSSLSYGKKAVTLIKGAVPKIFGNEITPNTRLPGEVYVRRRPEQVRFKKPETITEPTEDTTTVDITSETSTDNNDTISDVNNEALNTKTFTVATSDKKKTTDRKPKSGMLSDLADEEKINLILDNKFRFTKDQVPLKTTADEKLVSREIIQTEVAFASATKEIKVHCTVCDKHLGTSPLKVFDRFTHPVLNTLLCESCFHFYNTGEFTKDEDGSEIYCKWCAQGGTVMCCSSCPLVFCKDCILRNLGADVLSEIENADTWDCFNCNTLPLTKMHILTAALYEYTEKQIIYAISNNNEEILRKDISLCCKPDNSRKRKEIHHSEEEEEEEEEVEYIPAPKKRTGPTIRISNEADSSAPDLEKSKITQSPRVTLLNKSKVTSSTPTSSLLPGDSMPSLTPIMKIRAIPTALLLDPKNESSEASPKIINPSSHLRKIAPTPPILKRLSLATPNSSKQETLLRLRVNMSASDTPPPLICTSAPPLVPTSAPPLSRLSVAGNSAKLDADKGSPPLRSAINQKWRMNQYNRTSWLKTAISSSSIGVRSLLETYNEIEKDSTLPKSPAELAELHNKMQHCMSHCTNLLIETRKKMHREFLEYLSKTNVSHSSVGRNGTTTASTAACEIVTTTSTTTTPKVVKSTPPAVKPVKPAIKSAGGVTVPVISANRSQIVLKKNAPLVQTSTTPTGLKILNKPMLLKSGPNQPPVILRPGHPPLAVRPAMNLHSNMTPLQGLKPVILQTVQPGIRVSKGSVVIPNKPQNNRTQPAIKSYGTVRTSKSTNQRAGGIGTIKIANNLNTNVFINLNKPSVEKDPLAISDDEEENSMLRLLQPEVAMRADSPVKMVNEDELVKIKIEDDT
ncbi:uncharacterized protein [Atheta coriaria]|uniref:uncharacterized protein isoform X1 n=1 Tax=Dalotia coriaria TaxID=877792 RepID=UPI0031F38244